MDSSNPWGEVEDRTDSFPTYSPPPLSTKSDAVPSWNDTSLSTDWGDSGEATITESIPIQESVRPVLETEVVVVKEELDDVIVKDWGAHGEENEYLPNILPLKGNNSPIEWQSEQDWEYITTALPTFGDSFTSKSQNHTHWDQSTTTQDNWHTPSHSDQPTASPYHTELSNDPVSQKSISATLVNDLKSNSQDFGNQNWKSNDPFQQPVPELPPSDLLQSPTNSDTPLSSLFRLSTTTAPLFREGLEKTAQKAASTLIGSTNSLRNARFAKPLPRGNSSIIGEEPPVPPPSKAIGRAGDEFDLDARKDSPPPSAIGRFLGRFSKPVTHSASTSRSNSPEITYVESEGVTKVSIDVSSEIAEGNDFDAIFGSAPSAPPSPPPPPPQSPPSTVTQVKAKPVKVQTNKFDFDFFGDDEVSAPSMQPTRSTTLTPSIAATVLPPSKPSTTATLEDDFFASFEKSTTLSKPAFAPPPRVSAISAKPLLPPLLPPPPPSSSASRSSASLFDFDPPPSTNSIAKPVAKPITALSSKVTPTSRSGTPLSSSDLSFFDSL